MLQFSSKGFNGMAESEKHHNDHWN